ncbi:MAG: hypothetical protein ACI4PI_02935, partial [Oscillospiraceae bacterium]
QIFALFTKKLAYAAKILQISDEVLKLLSEAKTEEAFNLLEERKKVFETMQESDQTIIKILHSRDVKRAGQIKKILNLNELDNLKPEEAKLSSAVQKFHKDIKKIEEINNKLKLEFKREQEELLLKVAELQKEKTQILHSKKFLDAATQQENHTNWDIKL